MLAKINVPKVDTTKNTSKLNTSKVHFSTQKSTHFTIKASPSNTSKVHFSTPKSTHSTKNTSASNTSKVHFSGQKSTHFTKNQTSLKTNKAHFSTHNKGFGFKEKFFKFTEQLVFASNPPVGKQLLKLETPGIFLRVDGREPSIFHREGGLKPRVNPEQIVNLRFDDILNYQRFNQNPFGWGACRSFLELATFIANNKSHADSRWIIAFYGSGTSLLDLKLRTGIESDGFDNEAEQLVFNHVPFTHFLVATCPNFREKLMDGLLVPNLMHDFNSSLPKTLRKSDLCSAKQLLSWLLRHNCEEEFTAVCTHLYRDKSESTLKIMLEGDTYLVDAIHSALKNSAQDCELRKKM